MAPNSIAGIVAVALACTFGGAAGCRRTPARPPNAILVTIDTLRADHLGVYGYERDTSPNLDAIARAGVWVERLYTQSVTTRASHATIFTGCLPRTHGVLSNSEEYPDRPSLMTALRAGGYSTAGFVSSVVLNQKFGVQRQLDHFDDAATTTELNRSNMAERPARDTFQAVLAYLEQVDKTRPFFVWVHLIDPHGPYAAPVDPDRFVHDEHAKPGRQALPLGSTNVGFGDIPRYQILHGERDPDYYIARYDAEIRYADQALGEFVARLRALGLYDELLLVVTADHGETLDEANHRRYFSHGLVAYEEVSRIPLIVHEPHDQKRLGALDRNAPALTIDLAPTMLDMLGVEAPPEMEGRSMLRAPRAVDEVAYSLGSYGSVIHEKQMGTQWSLRRGPWRYIFNTLDGGEELYDHRVDPGEEHNVAAITADALEESRRLLADYMKQPAQQNRASDVSPEERERLKALGYVK